MPKKALTITLVILGLAAYVALSIWVVGMIRHGNITVPFLQEQNTAATTTTIPQETIPQPYQTTQSSTHLPTPTPAGQSPLGGALPTPTTIPTPAPIAGPGRYACDADGICGDFSDEARANCPKTFADPSCLGMCGTPAVRCSQ